ncbi:hypothetical protein Sango_3080000 [Sesamum angolense]|uniref:Reverse transcriptase domain-containing protein n=1 Tax=Sesamum angolense TaxID=2727404 RepID=A0AAE1T9W4_9LAMI|nr:hypothetical protein Sango_3080000 [Sesamum angolense]
MVGCMDSSGARGLRQGDPMSLYLFVLVMEVLHMILQQLIEQDGEFKYHWRCQELNLFQLSFADDLLCVCNADEGQLPVRYLGLRLFQHGFLSQIVNHCFRRLTAASNDGRSPAFLCWPGPIIKSVLISFEVYWAMAFILPKGIIKEMIKRLRTFLWKGNSTSGYPKVAWECRPIDEGGLCIKDILALNRALMSKHLWAVIKQDRTLLWVDWISQVRLRDCSIGQGPQLTSTGLLDKLSVVIKDGQWNWPLITDIACLEITYMLPHVEGPDRISWKSKDGSFNTSTVYDLFHPPGPRNAMQGDSNSVVDHPRSWAGLFWRGLDRGSSVSL